MKIWRYMDLAKFIALLSNRALYFTSASKFNDPYEFFIPEIYTKEIKNKRIEFITKCFEKAETIVRDLEKLPGLSKIKFGGKDINIIKLELFEYEKDEKIRRMKES
jgi:hypothetical protein